MSGGVLLLLIDSQNDFCEPNGHLFVPGAVEDMARLSALIDANRDIISKVVVTLDLHKYYHIAHSIFWENAKGAHPKPFTAITAKDMQNGTWTTSNQEHKEVAFRYLVALEEESRYVLTIWPPHCITGTWGSGICAPIAESIKSFEINKLGGVDYILKSTNSFTEHYSAVKAEIPFKADKDTLPNKRLLLNIAESEKVIIAGEALSHCVANTVMDMGVSLNGDLSKFILLRDASSPVATFDYLSDLFLEKGSDMGMKISDCANFKSLL